MTCRNEIGSAAQVIEIFGAGEGNRTLVISLEGCCSTIELHPHIRGQRSGFQGQNYRFDGDFSETSSLTPAIWWRGLDSNQRRRSQRIYSPSPLATRAPLRLNSQLGQRVRKPVTGRRICFRSYPCERAKKNLQKGVAADRGLLVNDGLVSIGLFSGKSRFFQRV